MCGQILIKSYFNVKLTIKSLRDFHIRFPIIVCHRADAVLDISGVQEQILTGSTADYLGEHDGW